MLGVQRTVSFESSLVFTRLFLGSTWKVRGYGNDYNGLYRGYGGYIGIMEKHGNYYIVSELAG